MSNANPRNDALNELIAAIEEGRKAWRRGMPLVQRTVELPNPPPKFSGRRIRLVRRRLGMSQAIFAHALAVSPITLQKWEQSVKSPSPQALRLLEIAERHPEVFLDRVQAKSRRGTG